jgi:hypothetical protein
MSYLEEIKYLKNIPFKLILPGFFDYDPRKEPIFNQTNAIENFFNFCDEDFYDCSICLGPLISPYKIKPCSHIFCFSCIKIWMETSKKCPLCRGIIKRINKI